MSKKINQMKSNIRSFELETTETKGEEKGDLYALKVSGDRMSPTINSGDMIVVDTRETKIIDGLYLLKFPFKSATVRGGLGVRRLQNRFDACVGVICDNPLYGPDPKIVQEKDLNVIGRCVGIMKKI